MADNLTQALVVLHPFRTYEKGDIVRDAATIADIRANVPASNFVVTMLPAGGAQPEKGP